MNDLTQFQTQNLFLLVGTNPLPNYVAAKLLLKPGGHLYLVHTSDTGEIANRLISTLGLDGRHATKFPVREADGDDISRQVSRYARDKHDVGLNYTGGTKTMAVHAYRAVEKACPGAVFSYLDARTLSMVVEHRDSPDRTIPVAFLVQLQIQTLLALHGYTLKHDPIEKPFQPKVCQELARIPCKDLRSWCDETLRHGPMTSIRKKSDLRSIPLPVSEPFNAVSAHWHGATTLDDLAGLWKLRVDKLAKWLDGKWLEHYTLWALRQIASECQIHQAGVSFEPRERDFEFDVAAMRGYQLFAVSCTTESKKRVLKLKLFEAYVRARQMGGDEARVGLVCCAPSDNPDNNPERIQSEIEETWDAKGKVHVFGAEHLANLPRHLANWFNSQP